MISTFKCGVFACLFGMCAVMCGAATELSVCVYPYVYVCVMLGVDDGMLGGW